MLLDRAWRVLLYTAIDQIGFSFVPTCDLCKRFSAFMTPPALASQTLQFSAPGFANPAIPAPAHHCISATAAAQGYDLVLGSDVCYSVRALPALFAAAARLLARRPGADFWLGYVSRCAERGIRPRMGSLVNSIKGLVGADPTPTFGSATRPGAPAVTYVPICAKLVEVSKDLLAHWLRAGVLARLHLPVALGAPLVSGVSRCRQQGCPPWVCHIRNTATCHISIIKHG